VVAQQLECEVNLTLGLDACQQLRALGVLDVRATLRLRDLTPRSRQMMIRYLREGWIRTTMKSGVGYFLSLLMAQYPPFWCLHGARKHNWLCWGINSQFAPEEVTDGIRQIAVADYIATKVGGIAPFHDFSEPHSQHKFLTIDPEPLVWPIVHAYTSTIQYQLKVKPIVDLIERNEDFAVQIKKPAWNGVRTT
jgi:hypothetical protein